MIRGSFRTFLVLGLCCAAVGCAYPRRSTSISPAPGDENAGSTVPDDVWHIDFLSAQIPPRTRSGHEWDDEDGPDPLIRLYRADELVWESAPVSNSLNPQFDQSPPRNVHFPRDQELRIELWDEDVANMIIGVWRGNGLPPNALPDAEATIMLEGGASISVRISRPTAHRGVGIGTYEARGSTLRVIEVEPFSPAGRAGIEAGDDITAIGEDSVADLGEARAASALSMAADRQSAITFTRNGQSQTVNLDRGLTWLIM